MPEAATIAIDRQSLRVTFTVHWFGILRVRGTFDGVQGHLDVTEERITGEVTIDAASVNTGIRLRDRHLSRDRFLDASSYPIITFRGEARLRGDGAPAVWGSLSLRGREIRLSGVPIWIVGRDQPRARWAADFEVQRRRHGVGVGSGLARFNPLLWAIGSTVHVRVVAFLPAASILTPAPSLGHGP
jgi:polyisoprenoid-binding protein YceI